MFTTLLSNNAITWVEYEKQVRRIVYKKYLRRLCFSEYKVRRYYSLLRLFCYLHVSKEQKNCVLPVQCNFRDFFLQKTPCKIGVGTYTISQLTHFCFLVTKHLL